MEEAKEVCQERSRGGPWSLPTPDWHRHDYIKISFTHVLVGAFRYYFTLIMNILTLKNKVSLFGKFFFYFKICLTQGITLIYHDLKLPIIVKKQQGFRPFVDDTLKTNFSLSGVALPNRNRGQRNYLSSNRLHALIVSNFWNRQCSESPKLINKCFFCKFYFGRKFTFREHNQMYGSTKCQKYSFY